MCWRCSFALAAYICAVCSTGRRVTSLPGWCDSFVFIWPATSACRSSNNSRAWLPLHLIGYNFFKKWSQAVWWGLGCGCLCSTTVFHRWTWKTWRVGNAWKGCYLSRLAVFYLVADKYTSVCLECSCERERSPSPKVNTLKPSALREETSAAIKNVTSAAC